MAVKKIFWEYPRLVLRVFHSEKGFFLAQAIAFKSLVTIIPVAMLALGILGRIVRSESNRAVVFELLGELVPTYLNNVVPFLNELQASSGAITLIGAVGSLFFATILCNTFCEVLTVIFEGPYHSRRSFLVQYAFSFRLLLQVGLIFSLTILLSFAIQTLNAAGTSFITKVGIDYVWIQTGWRRTIKFFGILIPFLLTFLMFFQLYFSTPKPHPPFKSVVLGAVLAAGAWELAKYFFSLYAANFAFFNQLQDDSLLGLGALDGTVGFIIALLMWLYYSGIVLILGGIVVMIHEKRHFARLEQVQ